MHRSFERIYEANKIREGAPRVGAPGAGRGSVEGEGPASASTLIVKTCQCGKRYTIVTWLDLPFAYHEDFPLNQFGPETHTEYRHCVCGSTIGVEVLP